MSALPESRRPRFFRVRRTIATSPRRVLRRALEVYMVRDAASHRVEIFARHARELAAVATIAGAPRCLVAELEAIATSTRVDVAPEADIGLVRRLLKWLAPPAARKCFMCQARGGYYPDLDTEPEDVEWTEPPRLRGSWVSEPLPHGLEGPPNARWTEGEGRAERRRCPSCGTRETLAPHQLRMQSLRQLADFSRCDTGRVVTAEPGRLVWREGNCGEAAYLTPRRCNRRACLDCARRRGRRVVDRWAPLFGAVLKDGYHQEMFTVGWERRAYTRDDVREYTRAMHALNRAMREGSPEYGIAPGTWIAGLRTLEAVPKWGEQGEADGFFLHAHLVLVRAAWAPYGLSTATWDDPVKAARAIGRMQAGKRRATGDPMAVISSEEARGIRALMRDLGLGEVGQHDRLDSPEDAENALRYLEKIQKYVGKIEKGAGREATERRHATYGARLDVLQALHGARLHQPFGEAYGVLAGPDLLLRRRQVDGTERTAPVERVGVLDGEDIQLDEQGRLVAVKAELADSPDFPLAGRIVVEDDGKTLVERWTGYREDKLARWEAWCDLDALKEKLLDGTRRECGKSTGPGSVYGASRAGPAPPA